MPLEFPTHNSQHGCYDQGAPLDNSEHTLSRIYDMLYAAEQAGLNHEQVKTIFSTLPESIKLEFNYSNWRYCNSNSSLQQRSLPPRHQLLAPTEPDDLQLQMATSHLSLDIIREH